MIDMKGLTVDQIIRDDDFFREANRAFNWYQLESYNFYESSYACPICGETMAKTVFRDGCELAFKIRDSLIQENINKTLVAKRTFTCPKCGDFFFAAPGANLNEKNEAGFNCFFELRIKSQYYMDFIELIGPQYCTTTGRYDYNEII